MDAEKCLNLYFNHQSLTDMMNVKDNTRMTTDDLFMDYVASVKRIPPQHQPLWVAYKMEGDTINLIAEIEDNDNQALDYLYEAETDMNVSLFEMGSKLMFDTMVFEKRHGVLPSRQHILIFGKQ